MAFAEARRMADPVMRPTDGQGDEKDLSPTDLQAGHAHRSGHPSRGVLANSRGFLPLWLAAMPSTAVASSNAKYRQQ